MTPDDARRILELGFDHVHRQRIGELKEKSRENMPTRDERSELQSYEQAISRLNELQSKARQFLKDAGLEP